LCAVSNHIRRFKRPEYIAHRDFTPIECLPDDCLVKDYDVPPQGVPESVRRLNRKDGYEVGERIWAQDLFAGRYGSKGVCGGYALFEPGAGLPCHTHEYDESITIVEGIATCQCAGAAYQLGSFDTICVPRGRPHRFVNNGSTPMHMIWVYAGDEPDRVVVDQGLCELGY
jgi:quercetin dioxygenase-like cupin family protein